MKIGIVRHFKVKHIHPRYGTSADFDETVRLYNTAEVTANELLIGEGDWQRCYSSVLPRAITTAKTIFPGEVVHTELLNEVPAKAVFTTKIKLPTWFWSALGRLAWLFNHSGQVETRRQTQQRAATFIEQYCQPGNGNVLIVTHGWFMLILQFELLKHGFTGKRVFRPVNGRLYVYEKKE